MHHTPFSRRRCSGSLSNLLYSRRWVHQGGFAFRLTSLQGSCEAPLTTQSALLHALSDHATSMMHYVHHDSVHLTTHQTGNTLAALNHTPPVFSDCKKANTTTRSATIGLAPHRKMRASEKERSLPPYR